MTKEQLRLKMQTIWNQALEYDRIPLGTKFAVFSDHNPYAKKYQTAMAFLLTGRAETYIKHEPTNNGQAPEFTR